MLVTQYERTSIPLTPQQKQALDNADRPMSEIVRDLVDAWRQKDGDVTAGLDVAKEELQRELETLKKQKESIEEREQMKKEKLERLEGDRLLPDDEKAVKEICEKDLTPILMNPESEVTQNDYTTATLDAKQAILEVARRKDSTPIDELVYIWRQKGIDNLSSDNAPTNQFTNEFTPEPSAEFVVKLLKTRNKALPDDYEPEETDERELRRNAVGGRP